MRAVLYDFGGASAGGAQNYKSVHQQVQELNVKNFEY
jgi:hypothetical protein